MPSSKDIFKQISQLNTDAEKAFFVNQISTPEYLPVLRDLGFFSTPPLPIKDDKGVKFELWYASRYLLRIADKAPAEVMAVAKEIPETENFRVHEDILDILIKIPITFALEFLTIDKAKYFLENPYNYQAPDKISEIIRGAALANHPDEALNLAELVFVITWQSKFSEFDGEEVDIGNLFPKFFRSGGSYDFEKQIRACRIPLIDCAGFKAVRFFLDLLSKAISISKNKGKTEYSWVWLPAIEEHEQNASSGLEAVLAANARDTLEYVFEINPVWLDKARELLSRYKHIIFKRLDLHILRLFAEQNKADVVNRLLDKELFKNPACYHEYTLLLHEQYSNLKPVNQNKFLNFIAEIEGDYIESTQFKWLDLIKNHLKNNWLKKYKTLQQKYGDPPFPTFLSYTESGPWSGPTSPLEDLSSMTVKEITDFLQTWKPSGERTWPPEPSAVGLGRQLKNEIVEQPVKFAKNAAMFIGVNPKFLIHVFFGFQNAVKGQEKFEWDSILELCLTIAKGDSGNLLSDASTLSEARKHAAGLLKEGFNKGVNEIPYKYKKISWDILVHLAKDPDPSPSDEQGSGMGPSLQAINSARGTAIEAVILYGIWHWRNLQEVDKWRGVESIPEVRELLESHLDPKIDPSPAIRSVYGIYFPWFEGMDNAWAKKVVDIIFPLDKDQVLFNAAWETYISYNHVYNNAAMILTTRYEKAIRNLEVFDKDNVTIGDPEARLAEHMIVMYERDLIGEPDGDSLFKLFWDYAPLSVRKHAISSTGISLSNTEGEVPEQIREKLINLIKFRIGVLKDKPLNDRFELTGFQEWFNSEKFDMSWAIASLLKILELTEGQLEHGWVTVKKLVEIADQYPEQVIKCLSLILLNDTSGWVVMGSGREVVPALLEIKNKSSEIKQLVEELGESLFQQKRFEYADLMDKSKLIIPD